MRQFAPEELEEVEYFASLMYANDDLARILDVDKEELRLIMKAEQGDLYRAIIKGRYTTESANRDAIIKMAGRGSTPAQDHLAQMIRQMKGENS